MDLKERIGFAFVLSIFSLVIAGLFPSAYTLTFSAILTTVAVAIIAVMILKDDSTN